MAPGVWRITTPLPFRPRSVHAYLARLDEGGWMLVDGGADTDAAWAALSRGVLQVAGGWGEVRLLAITHMHVDHVGLAARAHDASGAPITMGALDAERWAHAAAHPAEESEYRHRMLMENGAPPELDPARPAATPRPPLPIGVLLPSGTAPLPGATGWSSVWTPGHTAGHTSLFRAADRVLIAGDAVLPSITPTIGINRQREDPVADFLGSLARLARLGPTLGLPGHGEPMPDVARRIDRLGEETHAETARVAALLTDRPATAWGITQGRYPGRELPPSAWMQALRETRAHLDFLARKGGAWRWGEGGVTRFRRC